MSESFAKPYWRRAVLALVVAVAFWLIYAGVRHEIADYYGSSTNPGDWLRAAEIEPGNGENWYRLGRYRQLDFEHTDLPLAISYYRRAVQINPQSPYYKLDLATALETSGANAEAEQYFRQAQENYPISAEVAWRYGNFLLRQQRLTEAYAEIHRAVLVDPKLIPLAVSRIWHSSSDVRALLDQVLPNTAAGDWEALSFLVGANEGPAAVTVSDDLIAMKPAIDSKRLFSFIGLLIDQGNSDQAGSVWRQTQALETNSSPPPADGSIVYDGGFERDLSGGGFGWVQQDVPGTNFDFDTDEKHSGMRSARVSFDGKQNLNYEHLTQLVLVEPGTHYRFRGFLRTDQISTDMGIQFEIRDARAPGNLAVVTANVIRTQPWMPAEIAFTTGPNTHLVRIAVRRFPSAHFDNQLGGTVWVDDVSIIPVDSK